MRDPMKRNLHPFDTLIQITIKINYSKNYFFYCLILLFPFHDKKLQPDFKNLADSIKYKYVHYTIQKFRRTVVCQNLCIHKS